MEATKKRMTGLIAMMCAIALLSLGLFACGGSSDDAKKEYIGSWKLTGMTEKGEAVSANDLKTMEDYGMKISLTISEDGNFELTYFGEAQKGTWEAKSATEASFIVENETIPAKLEDGKLTLSENDVAMTFEKDDSANKK